MEGISEIRRNKKNMTAISQESPMNENRHSHEQINPDMLGFTQSSQEKNHIMSQKHMTHNPSSRQRMYQQRRSQDMGILKLNDSESADIIDEVEHLPQEPRGLTRINSPYIPKKSTAFVQQNKNATALRFQHNLKERAKKEGILRNHGS